MILVYDIHINLGANHPDTVRTNLNVASTYYSQGKYHEAELLMKESLLRRIEIFGEW